MSESIYLQGLNAPEVLNDDEITAAPKPQGLGTRGNMVRQGELWEQFSQQDSKPMTKQPML